MGEYCQNCRQPIDVDPSLALLNPASFDLLVGTTGKSHLNTSAATISRLNYPQERKDLYDQVSTQANSPVYKRSIPAPHDGSRLRNGSHPKGNADMSFIEITQSQVAMTDRDHRDQRKRKTDAKHNGDSGGDYEHERENRLSAEKDKVEDLFAILSSHSDIDHPMCQECTSIMLSHYTTRLGSANRERDAYAGFLKSTQQNIASEAHKQPEAKNTNTSLFEQLERTELELRKLEEEIAVLEDQLQQEESDEQAYWTSRNLTDDTLYQTSTHVTFLREKQTHDFQQLERLQRTNVYNDTFCVGHDGYFGTINGLRLGRLPNQNVDWSEINAAWGQTLLLLATVAERLRYTFQGYRIRPQGSTSRIEKLEYPQQSPDAQRQAAGRDRGLHSASANPEPKITPLDLFSSGDMAIGRLLNHRRFDSGMVAFLDCLAQLGRYVEKATTQDNNHKPSLRNATIRNASTKRVLPYAIDGDKIGGVSIKLGVGFHQDENFTKACKYALTCCKYLLAYVSNLEIQKEA
ncbi:Vacuolar protein sorting-associated protein atg6 [Cladophialophora chaetospira]|uniref:Vacuolar protein sorting-associated protein atg6 n=1 Tax=Cladophialophora chaetospira TaxID=386627 RepID=A0AA38XBG8_9EURO|nr:Vacuolar protein sorting-associated protein atg6 [Cladophialophora chaetospira]